MYIARHMVAQSFHLRLAHAETSLRAIAWTAWHLSLASLGI